MRLIPLTFRDDPADYTARLVRDRGGAASRTLLVVPTQRFKVYFARHLLRLAQDDPGPGGGRIAPGMVTSANLLRLVLAGVGGEPAVDMERIAMLHEALGRVREIHGIVPKATLSQFGQFSLLAHKILASLDELAREKISLRRDAPGDERFRALRRIAGEYARIQGERSLDDPLSLIPRVEEDHILRVFAPYGEVILVSPLALTAFERSVYDAIGDRLTVVYQDDDAGGPFDFSRVIAFRVDGDVRARGEKVIPGGGGKPDASSPPGGGGEGRGKSAGPPPAKRFASSRMDELSLCLAWIQDAIDAGVPPEEIVVVNIDEKICEMIYDALSAADIPVNLSAGKAVSASPLFQFFRLLQRFFGSGLDTRVLLRLLRNDFVRELLAPGGGGDLAGRLAPSVLRRRIFTLKSLEDTLIASHPPLHATLLLLRRFVDSRDFHALGENLTKLLSLFGGEKDYPFYAVRDRAVEAAVELTDLPPIFTQRPYDVFLQLLGRRKYSLRGDILRGVQIIGLLETRGIRFSRVVVPSLNEGFLPVAAPRDLFLCRSTRRELGMPTFLDAEELEFYYLKRLVEGADRVMMCTLTEGSGEVKSGSRFLHLFEEDARTRPSARAGREGRDGDVRLLPVARPGRPLGSIPRPPAFGCSPGSAPAVPRRAGGPVGEGCISLPPLSEPVLGFSRRDIQIIGACETRYYCERMLSIPAPEPLKDDIEMRELGLRVHSLFRELYGEMDFRSGTPEVSRLRERVKTLFHEHFPPGIFHTGEEALMRRLLRENLQECVENDCSRFEEGFRVDTDFLERTLQTDLPVEGMTVRFNGRIDRVDRSPEGALRVIDYKTGSLPAKKSHRREGGFGELQLAFYGWLLRRNNPGVPIESLGYVDVNGSKDFVEVVGAGDVDTVLGDCESHLVELVRDLNGKEVLALTDDRKNCRYCPYDLICRITEA